MPRGAPRTVESTPAQDRIRAAETAIRKLQFEKRKIDLEIQKHELDIEAAKEELKVESVTDSQPSLPQPKKGGESN